ncbi:hypothetical protein [Pelistega suis]|uniref:hypothetical protein n=1 Tax=Pelistega suis TaxID=1631957 RepID=UPI00211C9167|nr:hypothetical protein [Pelistega suis]MCQ9327917.1 hypothetical protein [Pelistega suis]
MDNKCLYGTHGTCRTFADSIVQNQKFNLGHGRHGYGVYLWQSHSADNWTLAEKLAMTYAKHISHRFKKEKDASICCLKCTLSVPENRFYDLVCHEHHSFFLSFLDTISTKLGQQELKKHEWTGIYNAFFSLIKKTLAAENGVAEDIDVYFVLAEAPFIKEHKSLYTTTHKSAGCYVVRNNNVFTKIERSIT